MRVLKNIGRFWAIETSDETENKALSDYIQFINHKRKSDKQREARMTRMSEIYKNGL